MKKKKKHKWDGHNCWCSCGWEWDSILKHKITCANEKVPKYLKSKP